jgi:hypothetical protein
MTPSTISLMIIFSALFIDVVLNFSYGTDLGGEKHNTLFSGKEKTTDRYSCIDELVFEEFTILYIVLFFE